MSVLICFALKEEAAPFQKFAAGKPGLAILITGIGRRNAENSVRKALAARPASLVLTCGFAGGLDPRFQPGDVLFEPADSGSAVSHSDLAAKLAAAGAFPARFFCADRIAITAAEKQALRAGTGADAVEMESAAIHALCRERGIAGATVRAISDAANEDLPLDFNALAKPDQSLDFGKLAWAVAKSPGKIAALLELQKKTRLAAAQLARVLERVVR